MGAPSAAPSSYLIQHYAPCVQRRGCVPRGMPMYLLCTPTPSTVYCHRAVHFFATLLALQYLSASLVPSCAVLRELELAEELPIRNFSATRKSSHPRALQLAAPARSCCNIDRRPFPPSAQVLVHHAISTSILGTTRSPELLTILHNPITPLAQPPFRKCLCIAGSLITANLHRRDCMNCATLGVYTCAATRL